MLKLHINSFGLNLNFYLFYVIWWSTQKVSLIVVTISNFLSSEQSPFFTSIWFWAWWDNAMWDKRKLNKIQHQERKVKEIRLFWIPKKSLLKSFHPKSASQIFLPKNIREIENFKPRKILRSSPPLTNPEYPFSPSISGAFAIASTWIIALILGSPVLFNSWVRASVPRVIAGTKICKWVTRSLVVDALRN